MDDYMSSEPSAGRNRVRLEDLIRDAQRLLHQGFETVELKDSTVSGPVRGTQLLADHVYSSHV